MKRLFKISLLTLLSLTAVSCADDIAEPAAGKPEIAFSGAVHTSPEEMETRADDLDDIDDGNYVVLLKEVWEDQDFYIHQTVNDAPGNTEIYTPASSVTGSLVAKSADAKPLKWGKETDTHIFHGWTLPAGTALGADGVTGTVDYNTKNRELEYFIGTRRGPVSYAENGASAVELRFRHLVSRLRIGDITHKKADSSTDENALSYVRAITFPNLPNQSVFDTGITEDTFPHVKDMAGCTRGITFYDKDAYGLNFDQLFIYTPPFRWADENGDSTGLGKFYVTFGPENEPDKITIYTGDLVEIATHLKEIKAGESMTLNFQLKDEEITGIYVYLQPWNTKASSDVMQRPDPGIYSKEDLYDFIVNHPDVDEKYVYVNENGEKVVRLFDNIQTSGALSEIGYEGYVFDGMDHNIDNNGRDVTLKGTVNNLYVNGKRVGNVQQ